MRASLTASFLNNQSCDGVNYDSVRFGLSEGRATFELSFYREGIELFSEHLDRGIHQEIFWSRKPLWTDLKKLIKSSNDFKLLLKCICSGPSSLTQSERLHLMKLKVAQKNLTQVAEDHFRYELYYNLLKAAEEI